MKTEQVRGTVGHLHAIMAAPCGITLAEMSSAGVRAAKLKELLGAALRVGEAETLLLDGEPAVQLGFTRRGNVLHTWFVATEAFMGSGARGVLFGRRYMRELAARHPGAVIESMTWSTHPDTVRWFELLGYEYARHEGKARVFRYPAAQTAQRDKAA